MGIANLPPSHADDHHACLERAIDDLRPATPDEIDIAVLAISAMPSQAATGVTLDALELLYRIGLDDLPVDLLNEGVRQAIKTSRFRPMPEAIREFGKAELEARRRRLARLQVA